MKTSILAISDVHIGCPRLNPKLLHDKFVKFLYPQITSEISILFICGDFFDNLLNLNAYAAFVAMDIIKELKHLCRQVGCDLRVLRGTFTHDRDQPKHFVNGEDPEDLSVRLFDKLAFEHHARTGLNIIYIPDNLKCDDIYENIHELLESHNLEKADILVHHGYFKHMLPEALIAKGLPHGCLEVDKIQKYVKGCVLNGHVHISSIYQNVISIGSFDRLAHGEEEPKGFYRIDIDEAGYKFKFIENKDATKFITYNLLTFNSEQAVSYFNSEFSHLVEKLRDDEPIRVRVISDDKAVLEGCTQIAKGMYKNVMVDQGSMAKRSNTIENVATDLSELPIITDKNLVELLMPILKKQDPSVKEETVKAILISVGCNPD